MSSSAATILQNLICDIWVNIVIMSALEMQTPCYWCVWSVLSSSYSTFPPIFMLVSPVSKQAWSNWNLFFVIIFKMSYYATILPNLIIIRYMSCTGALRDVPSSREFTQFIGW